MRIIVSSTLVALFSLALLIGLTGCGGGVAEPLPELIRMVKDEPTFSIILDDMKDEGTFSTQYFQKFRVLVPQKSDDKSTQPAVKTHATDWVEVPEAWYKRNMMFLGMTIYSRTDGKASQQAGPPGYEYVGNPKYGRWRQDSSGNRMWEFFAGYAMMNMLLGNRPVYYRDYQDYRGYGNRPYFGRSTGAGKYNYGTNGTVTRKQKPTFYTRRMNRQASQKSTFSQRVNSRIGRTRTAARGRSRGFGK
jgi:hypothetical protein